MIAGRFRVVRLLGRGGMGEVYEAVQLDLDRPVAIKVLPAGTGDLGAIEREARAAARLAHPHIVQVTDLVQPDDGPPFLVMELLEGESLAERIVREKRVDASRAALIAVQVLSALAAAHAAGIVHRDVKPANVFLARTAATHDFVKLLDFGVARVTHGSPGSVTSARLVGTPAYMAPEQIRGDTADARTDVYAVGVCLYEMLSGASPFTATNVPSLLVKICEAEPNPLADVDAGLAAIVARAMSKEPAARFASADAMRIALVPFAASAPVPSRGLSPPARVPEADSAKRERQDAPTVPLAVPPDEPPAPRATPLVPPAERTYVAPHAREDATLASSPAAATTRAPPPSAAQRWAPAIVGAAIFAAALGLDRRSRDAHAPSPSANDCALAPITPHGPWPIAPEKRLSVSAAREELLLVVESPDGNPMPYWFHAYRDAFGSGRQVERGEDDLGPKVFASATVDGVTPVIAFVSLLPRARVEPYASSLLTLRSFETPRARSEVTLPARPKLVAVALAAPFGVVAASSGLLSPDGVILTETMQIATTDILRGGERLKTNMDFRSDPPASVHAAASTALLAALFRYDTQLVLQLFEPRREGDAVPTKSIPFGGSNAIEHAALAVVEDAAYVMWSERERGVRWAAARVADGVTSSGGAFGGEAVTDFALGARGDRLLVAWSATRDGWTKLSAGEGRDVGDAIARAAELESAGVAHLALTSGTDAWVAWSEPASPELGRSLHAARVQCK